MNAEACMSLVQASLQGLLALCSMTSAPAVREQACHALCRLARPSAGCHACSHLQAAGAPLTLLQLLRGIHMPTHCPPCNTQDSMQTATAHEPKDADCYKYDHRQATLIIIAHRTYSKYAEAEAHRNLNSADELSAKHH